MWRSNTIINKWRIFFAALMTSPMLFTSCHEDMIDVKTQNIKIDVDAKENIVNLSDIADSITFVSFETTDESVFGCIDKLMIYNGQYVVVDKEAASAVFVFDSEGHFLHKVGRKGRSKSEYIELTDAALGDGNIYIYDARGKRVVRYTMDGNCVESYPVGFDATAFRHVSGDLFAFYCGYTSNMSLSENGKIPNLVLYDFSSKKIQKDFMYNEDCSYDAIPIEINNLNPFLYGSLSTNVYDIDKEGVHVVVKIDYGKSYNERLSSFVEKVHAGVADMKDFQKKMAEGAFPMLINFMDCGNAYFAFCNKRGKLFYNFHFLKSDKVVNAVGNGCIPVKDDIYDCITLLPKAALDGYIYTDIESDAVNPNILQNIDANGNPVIVKIKLKE